MGVFREELDRPGSEPIFRAKYKIPDDVEIRLDDPDDPHDGRFREGWMPFPLVSVTEGGVRFPLNSFLRTCLNQWRLSPSADAQWV